MEILVIAILILINGFFALSEIALVSSKKPRLEQKKTEGSNGAKTALKLLENSETFLSAIQVGITLIGILTGVYGGMRIADDIAPFLQQINFIGAYADELALFITVVVITYFSIVIGELVPKTFALSNPVKIAIRVAPVVYYFSKAFYPFVKLLSVSTNLINTILGIKKPTENITEAELRQMMKIASKEGVIKMEQNVIHEKVFYFSDKKAKHILTHRSDVEWIDVEKPVPEINELLENFNHSRIICCRNNLDNFVGVLFLKDFYKALVRSKNFAITDVITEPLIVHENLDAQKVLEVLRSAKKSMCFVVNEYGGFEGIITLHDIIENIVGEIPEEYDVYEPDVFTREDKSVLVNGDAPVEILSELIQNFTVDFEEIEYSTVAGFVFHHLDKVPHVGDKFDYMDYKIEIVDMDRGKIDKILLTKKNPEISG
jgi:putative hemolysin